jgi:formamidopyrimidine-DNA glycosylase
MSIELPEASILSRQMNSELQGKQIANYQLQNYQKMQRIGFINKRLEDFDKLTGCKVHSVVSRGNSIHVKLDNDMNLLLAPEYGGKILYHSKGSVAPAKFHFKLCFNDDTALTVTLTSMGVIKAVTDNELEDSYIYKRDFLSTALSPIDEAFTFEHFAKELADKTVNIKAALVGKDAILVGLSNSAFQDVIYRAQIHPKRKASSLSNDEKTALYKAITLLIQERIQKGGKDQFVDLYGKQGAYTPAMGPNMKGQNCPICQTKIEKISHGGGQVYLCPKCQN